MQDRVGEVWAVTMFAAGSLEPQAAIAVVVRTSLENGVHRLLVLDGGATGWSAGELRTHGELQEYPGDFGSKRIA